MVNRINVGYSKKCDFDLKNLDVAVFPFGAFDKVTFKSELSGKSKVLSEMVKLSKNLSCVCFFGVETDSYGLKRDSVVCVSDGKILGISDANRKVGEKISVSHGYKIYNTDIAKFGVLVGDDILDIDAIKCFSKCECDLVIAICRDFVKFRADYLVQTLSFLYGISICFFAGDNAYFSTPKGELEYLAKDEQGARQISVKRSYTQYIIKQRGET